MSKGRFEAFSDGVFAFAVTLLVLGIVLPGFRAGGPTNADLTSALFGLWPSVVAYALSFAVIGIMWQNHHALFRLVTKIDRTTVLLNLLLLCVTVFIPFATSLLGKYPTMHASTFLYGLVLTSSATAYNLLLGHLVRKHAFKTGVTKATIDQTVVAYRVGLVTYSCAMLVSLAVPWISFALYLFVVAYFFIPRGADADVDV